MKLIEKIKKTNNEDLVSVVMMLAVFIINAILIMIEWFTIFPQFNLHYLMYIYWIFWILALFCFYKCFITDVSVPENIQMDTSTYSPCTNCGYGKPERTHHCSQCKQCVYGMNHHCSFIGNCIGHANRKYFILMNLYVVLMMLFVVCIIFPLGIYATIHPKRGPFYHWLFRIFDIVQLLLGGYVCTILYLTLPSILSGLFCNLTTLEMLNMKEKVFFSTPLTRRKNKYDLGTTKNIQQVFGTSIWKALLPINTYDPNQYLQFEYNNECIEQNELEIQDYDY